MQETAVKSSVMFCLQVWYFCPSQSWGCF